MTIPQLRVRTEFSFGETFAPIPKVVAHLDRIATPAAGIVDPSTWGHVKWKKACEKAGIRPLYGTEAVVKKEDGTKPLAWAIMGSSRPFYQFSTALRKPDADVEALFLEYGGQILRFAGAALTDPDTFDYIDINPSSRLLRRRSLELAAKTGKPIVITSDNWMSEPEDRAKFLAIGGREKLTPDFILKVAQLRASIPELSEADWNTAVANTHAAARLAGSDLARAPLISVNVDFMAMVEEGKRERLRLGHLSEWTDVHQKRLERELGLIAEKKYESYFAVVAGLIKWAKERMLVGPGRGSSAGSLVCYLLRITEVNPLDHDLLFERFIDVSRNDLPDIDIDFCDRKRELIFDYLADVYGAANIARIGNVNTLKARSVIARVSEKLGIPDREKFDVVNVLIEYSSGDSRYGHALEDTLKGTLPGQKFLAKYPKAELMFDLENHASHSGVHAAGVIVCNEPVSDFCTVGPDGVAHLDKPDMEHLGLLKIDALGLRTLGVIEDSGVVTNDQLYALTLDDPSVFEIFNQRKFAGIFQFEGQAQRLVSAEVNIDSFRKIDHVTALARPGPLGGGASQRYIARAAGREAVTYRHPSMEAYLGKTMGVVLYQEQVMKICAEIGQFDWATISEIRKSMSGRKGKEYFDRRGAEFMDGAQRIGLPREEADEIWNEICTFGAWGMNASHTVSYGVISYWCAWMKRYHPLEYAAACLRNAKDDDQVLDLLRELDAEGVKIVPFDFDKSEVDWAARDGAVIGGFKNIVGFGQVKASAAIDKRAAGKLNREDFANVKVKFSELYPLRSRYGDIYENPENYGCRDGSWVATGKTLPDEGDVLYIGSVVGKKLRDENESLLLARREGKRRTGPTAFLDLNLRDDTGVPIIGRINRFNFREFGSQAAELRVGEDDVMIRGRRIPGFSMIQIDRIRCLNRPEVFRK